VFLITFKSPEFERSTFRQELRPFEFVGGRVICVTVPVIDGPDWRQKYRRQPATNFGATKNGVGGGNSPQWWSSQQRIDSQKTDTTVYRQPTGAIVAVTTAAVPAVSTNSKQRTKPKSFRTAVDGPFHPVSSQTLLDALHRESAI